MPLFIVAGVLGLMFFVASLIFGDHDIGGHDHDFSGDHDGQGPGVFSVFNVSWFLIGFGGTGAIVRANGVGIPGSTISGVLAGAFCLGLAFLAMRAMAGQQGDSTVTASRIMNATGTVVLSIPEHGVGKIQCSVAGSSQELLARSVNAKALPEGSRVRILNDVGGVYMVETI